MPYPELPFGSLATAPQPALPDYNGKPVFRVVGSPPGGYQNGDLVIEGNTGLAELCQERAAPLPQVIPLSERP